MKSGLLPKHTARSQNSKLSSELNPKVDQAACARCLSLALCAAAGCCRAAPPSPPTCSQRMRAGWRRKVPRATPARDGRRICYLYGHQRAGHHVAIARLPTTPCPRVRAYLPGVGSWVAHAAGALRHWALYLSTRIKLCANERRFSGTNTPGNTRKAYVVKKEINFQITTPKPKHATAVKVG